MLRAVVKWIGGAAWWLPLSLVFGVPPAWAQGNSQSQALGGTSALMGGTGVVLGSDSAAPFLNPAGVARINQSSLALSAQLVELSHRKLVGFRQPDSSLPDLSDDLAVDDADVTNVSLSFVPSAFCYFQNIRPDGDAPPTRTHTFAFCIGATESEQFAIFGDSATASNEALRFDVDTGLQLSWARTNFGLSWGHYFSRGVAVGASLMAEEASQNVSLGTGALLENLAEGSGIRNAYSLSRAAQSLGLRVEAGALFQVAPRWSLGVSARTPSWVFAGSVASTEGVTSVDGSTRRTALNGSFAAPTPIRFAAGVGYEDPKLQLELDVFVFLPDDAFLKIEADREVATVDASGRVQRSTDRVVIAEPSNLVFDVAVGARYALGSHWSLLAGFQTDFSMIDRRADAPAGERIVVATQDLYHASMGAGYRGALGQIVTGLRFSHARGDALAPDTFTPDPAIGVAEVREFSVLFVLYGSLDFGALADRLKRKPKDEGSEVSTRTSPSSWWKTASTP